MLLIFSVFAEKFNFFGFFWLFIPFALYLAASRSANLRHISNDIKIASAFFVLFISFVSILQYVFKINPFKAPLPYATFGNPMYLGAWLAMLLPLCADAWFAESERKSEAINPDKSEKFPLNQIPSNSGQISPGPSQIPSNSPFTKGRIPFSKGEVPLFQRGEPKSPLTPYKSPLAPLFQRGEILLQRGKYEEREE